LAARLVKAEAALKAAGAEQAAAREVADRVRVLETEKTALAGRVSEIATAQAEAARATAATAAVEEKLAVALRSYSALTKERDDLAASLAAAQAKPAPVASPEFEARLRQLEADKAALTARLAESAAMKEDLARATAAQAEAEEKLAMSLRSYTALAKERDELAASLAAKPPLPVPTVAPTRPVVAATTPIPVPPTAKPAEAPRTHTVVMGDTLTRIALRYYGNANRWPEILAANRDVLRSERDLFAGRVLRIP
jgi:nucleoid-associated protein YgaU